MNRAFHISLLLIVFVCATSLHAEAPTTRQVDDIEDALNSRIDFKMTGLTTVQAIKLLQELTHLNLLVDWNSLSRLGLWSTEPLDGELKNLPVKEVIRVILSQGGCRETVPIVRDGHLLRIAAPLTNDVKLYNVTKILKRLERQSLPATAAGAPNQQLDAIDYLIDRIQQTIDPDSWRENSGTRGRIRMMGQGLLVVNSPQTLAKIDQLIAQLEKDDAK